MVLSLLIGCVAGSAEDTDSYVPSDGSSLEPRDPESSYSAEEAGVALMDGLFTGVPLPPAIVDTWLWFMMQGDAECPGNEGNISELEVFSPQGCTAASGFWYQGVGAAGENQFDTEMDGVIDGYVVSIKVDGMMRDDQAQPFYFGGTTFVEFSGTRETGGTVEGEFQGSYGYAGSSTAWLAEGISVAMYIDGELAPDGEWSVTLDGGFSVGDATFSMQDLSVNETCPGQLAGTLGFRDDRGYWYDFVYDETTCDGCGTVWFDGREELGYACAGAIGAFEGAVGEFMQGIFAAGGGAQ